MNYTAQEGLTWREDFIPVTVAAIAMITLCYFLIAIIVSALAHSPDSLMMATIVYYASQPLWWGYCAALMSIHNKIN